MFTFDQLSEQVTAYREGRVSFDQFEEWFRRHSWGYYDRSGERLSDAIADVQAALSSYETDEITEEDFRLQLEDAVLHSHIALAPTLVSVMIPEDVLAARHSEIYEYLEARELNTCWIGSVRSSIGADAYLLREDRVGIPPATSATTSVSLEYAV